MGIDADILLGNRHATLAALLWQRELGVEEPVTDTPVNRYDLPTTAPEIVAEPAPARQTARQVAEIAAPPSAKVDAVAVAAQMAAGAKTLDDLRDAMARFDLCELKRGARNLVFADGNPKARVLILGEAPGQEEDREGRPFVGRAGHLLDRMFAAIGLSRQSPDAQAALYITNVLPWRPPGNRDPSAEEIAMMRPFVTRHIELVDPAVIVVMGNIPLEAMTGAKGITRARGNWTTFLNRPLLPMFQPKDLLRNPIAKREAWADLLALQERLGHVAP